MAYDTTPIPINSYMAYQTPPEVSREIIANTLHESAILQLARVIQMPDSGVSMPIITGEPEADWAIAGSGDNQLYETAEKVVNTHGLDGAELVPVTLAVIEPFSNQFRNRADALYEELIRRLPYALGVKLDRTAIGIDAAPPVFSTMASAPVVNLLDATDGKTVYSNLVGAMGAVAAEGFGMDGIGMSASGKTVLYGATDNTGRPVFTSAVDGGIGYVLGSRVIDAPAFAGTTSGNNIVGAAGDWKQFIVGLVGDVRIDISDQATLNYNGTQVNLWQRNMFAVRAEVQAAMWCNTDAFVKLAAND